MKKVGKILKKIIIFIIVALLVLLAGIAGVNLYVRWTVKDRILSVEEASELEDVDCIIVLGASVRNGNTPSPMLEDRLKKGIELYFDGCSPKLLMSGDHGSQYYDEVNVMKNYAKQEGVPSSDIFMDHAGFSTYESIYRVKEIYQADKIIIVTQDYHLYRALYIAKKLGVEAYGVPAEEIKYRGQSVRSTREVLATCKDFCKVILKPKPSILGAQIPIWGDGNITNDKD